MKNKLQRFISIFLSLVLVLQLVPVQALGIEPIDLTAEEISDTETPGMISQSTAAVNNAQIVGEILEGRSEFQKEFQLDNGMQMIAMYGKPVHYEEDGEWKEIDNTLRLTSSQLSLNGGAGDAVYRNTAGIWDVSLPANLNSNTPVTVSRDGYSLSFRFAGEIHNDHVIMGVEDETEQGSAVIGEVQTEAETLEDESFLLDSGELSGGLDAVTTENADPSAGPEDIAATSAAEGQSEAEGSVAELEESAAESIVIEEDTIVSADTPVEGEDVPVGEAEAPETPDNSSTNDEAGANDVGLSAPVSNSVETIETMALVQSSAARLTAVEMPADQSGKVKEQTILSKLNAALTYENIYANTDLRYDLVSHALKESIIIKFATETLAGYSYTLSADGLILELQDDNSILAYASDAEEGDAPIFTMPAPYLVDAAQAYSGDVSVSLAGSNGSYTLTYRLPRQWLMDDARVYPVTLDPIVDADSSTYTIEDQSVFQKNQFWHGWEYLEAGYDPGYGKERIFIKFTDLPELGSADVIVGASLFLGKCTDTNAETMEAHEVKGSWNSSTITWSNMPSCNSLVEDFQRVSTAGWYSWDITNLVQKWYEDGKNTGVMLRMSSSVESSTSSNFHRFYSSDAYQAYVPQLYITYLNNCGLEGIWDYTSQSAGRAGTGHINNFTGNLVWVHEGLSFAGNRMPVSISLVYNANDDGNNTYGFGYGWRTNYSQYVYKWSKDSNYYVLIDEDGTRRYFKYKSSNTYEYELDNALVLKTGLTGSYKYSITDKDGNVSYFNSNGHLVRIKNNQKTPSYIDITRINSSKLIDTIKDGAGRLYKFVYDASDRVSAIKYYGTDTAMTKDAISTLTYAYDDSNNLTSITYPDGEVVTYSYAGSTHLLNSAADIDGYSVSYTYSTTNSKKPNRITNVTEKDGDTVGGNLAIEYAHNQTTFKDHNDRVEIVQFNNYGSTVSIQDDQGRAQFAQYAGNDDRKSASQMTLSSKLQNTVVDLIRNGSFEKTDLCWGSISGSTESYVLDTETYYLEEKSLKVTNDTVAPTASYYATAEPGKSYTLSAYVKVPANTAASVSLRLSASGDALATTSAAPSSDWQRIEVTYTHPADAAASPLIACLTATNGDAWFDCVQLEQSASASRYNIIEDGDFRFSDSSAASGHYAWGKGAHCTTTEKLTTKAIPEGKTYLVAPQMNNTVYTITGTSVWQRNIHQRIYISGAEGDVYSLGGWAYGDSVPLTPNEDDSLERKFSLTFRFFYSDDTTATFEVDFNPDCDTQNNWQFVSDRFVAKKAYDSIQVMLSYNYNRNVAYFDGIQLFKEEFGQSYTYDKDGNVVSSKDLQGQETTYEYADNQLTKASLPTGVVEEYEYDEWKNVILATTKTGVKSTFEYDEYGNNTRVVVDDGANVLVATATYTQVESTAGQSLDGNQLESTTDPLGKITTYTYDANTGMLASTQAAHSLGAEDEDIPTTSYQYDALYRTTRITQDASVVAYNYDNDLLSTITSASGTEYTFTYGDFDLLQRIGIGERTLVSHDYTDDKNLYLEKSTYGNNDYTAYTYDELGRTLSKTYEDGDTVTYTYDNNGNLGQMEDGESDRTTRYYYDFQDQLSRYEEVGSDFNSVVTWKYDAHNNLVSQTHKLNGDSYTTAYTYNDDNQLTKTVVSDTTPAGTAQTNITGEYTYDQLGRMTSITSKNGESSVVSTTITFTDSTLPSPEMKNEDGEMAATSLDTTSSQVATWKNVVGETNARYSYTYDDRGNITHIYLGEQTETQSPTLLVSYEYDDFDQLTVEKDYTVGKRWEYTYDNGGNINTKTEYDSVDATAGTETTYGYTDTDWHDLLTSYNGQPLTYDGIGNLLDDGTWEYTWEHGRQLASMRLATDTYIGDTEASADPTLKNGIHTDDDGEVRYYVDGEAVYTGLIYVDGYYYYIRSSGVAARNTSYWVTNNNGLLPQKSYTFDANGRMVDPPAGEEIQLSYEYNADGLRTKKIVSSGTLETLVKDGLYLDTDGEIRYYDNGKACYTGLICINGDYYYINSTYKAVRNGTYWVTSNNGLLPSDYYTFGADGRIVDPPTDAEVGTITNASYAKTSAISFTRTFVPESSTTYQYHYAGATLTGMTCGSDKLYFVYDLLGPSAIVFNGTTYYYTRNAQGDIVGIVDSDGQSVEEYSYDAWGNPLSEPSSALGKLNPLRYRSYVFDSESGLYYLQSRYYNPASGRFVNADTFVSTGQGFTGDNMFAYCNNNPTRYVDAGGAIVIPPPVIKFAVGFAVNFATSFTGSLMDAAIKDEAVDGWKSFGRAVVDGLIGGAEVFMGDITNAVLAIEIMLAAGRTMWDGGDFNDLLLAVGTVLVADKLSSGVESVLKGTADECYLGIADTFISISTQNTQSVVDYGIDSISNSRHTNTTTKSTTTATTKPTAGRSSNAETRRTTKRTPQRSRNPRSHMHHR